MYVEYHNVCSMHVDYHNICRMHEEYHNICRMCRMNVEYRMFYLNVLNISQYIFNRKVQHKPDPDQTHTSRHNAGLPVTDCAGVF